jgi:hypothetical protein
MFTSKTCRDAPYNHRETAMLIAAPAISPASMAPKGAACNARVHWAQLQLSEYVEDLFYWRSTGDTFAKKLRTHFSGLTKIEKATLGRLRSGKFVRPWIIKRFARGLRLNAVDRAELYIRYGEMQLGWHIREHKNVGGWLARYAADPVVTITQIDLVRRLRPKAARSEFGKMVRGILWTLFYASDGTIPVTTAPRCGFSDPKNARVRHLARKLGMTENALHDALTHCTFRAALVPRLAELLGLTPVEARDLMEAYLHGILARQILRLDPSHIAKHFKPHVHVRLAHWLAHASEKH